VLEYGRRYGEFLKVKIENMSLQHSETLKDELPQETVAPEKQKEKKKYGVVAVCNGAGVENLFKEFGADETISGGQTHNPSTQDFIETFNKISAENIFVFPNNSNIFMAAQQAADIYEGAKVIVLPSKNIGTGYVALSALDFDSKDIDSVVSNMELAMQRVTAAYVSPSIRDADMNGIHINNGDTIGIIDKEIVLSNSDRQSAINALSSMVLDAPDKFMLTVFVGIDAKAEEREMLENHIKENHPDAEVYFIDGGQEIYPFIFVAE
jgi:dihydroxyacetone kinase-like predicted kinase